MIAILLLACAGEDAVDTGDALDTDWFDAPAPACPDRWVSSSPQAGDATWYGRDPLTVAYAGDGAQISAQLVDGRGVTWRVQVDDDAERRALTLTPEVALPASSEWTLVIDDCRGRSLVPFATSWLGLPLQGGPNALNGRTWAASLRQATWEQPPGLGALIALYVDGPVLIGVQFADSRVIDLIGAQGYLDSEGVARPLGGVPSWDFPLSPFDDAPWFRSEGAAVRLPLDAGASLPVHGFTMEATVSPDGADLGGGRVSGYADTRDLGPVLDLGDEPGAVCDAAEGFGVACVPCPDGQPWCVWISARDVEGHATSAAIPPP